SVDLDTIPASSVPVIRVSETGSVVVTSEEAPPPAEQAGNVSVTPPPEAEGAAPATRPTVEAPAATVPAVADSLHFAPDDPHGPVPEARSFAPQIPVPADKERDESPSANTNTGAAVSVLAGVSSLVVILVFSYASAVTLLCGYLIWTRPSTLDLPDLEPPKVST